MGVINPHVNTTGPETVLIKEELIDLQIDYTMIVMSLNGQSVVLVGVCLSSIMILVRLGVALHPYSGDTKSMYYQLLPCWIGGIDRPGRSIPPTQQGLSKGILF